MLVMLSNHPAARTSDLWRKQRPVRSTKDVGGTEMPGGSMKNPEYKFCLSLFKQGSQTAKDGHEISN
jgi:hypothetical protein